MAVIDIFHNIEYIGIPFSYFEIAKWYVFDGILDMLEFILLLFYCTWDEKCWILCVGHVGTPQPETERSSRWQPWYSQDTSETSFNFSTEHKGCNLDDLSVSVSEYSLSPRQSLSHSRVRNSEGYEYMNDTNPQWTVDITKSKGIKPKHGTYFIGYGAVWRTNNRQIKCKWMWITSNIAWATEEGKHSAHAGNCGNIRLW